MSLLQKHTLLTAALLSVPIPYVAYAAVYLTEDQAQQAIFPGLKLKQSFVELSDLEIKQIEKTSHQDVRDKKIKIYRAETGETLFIDRVVGKHDYITFAVGIKSGKVQQIEILEYRETYGSEVKKAEWRKQFIGKSKDSSLKLNDDIQNISGATLSSAHVTAGVRRLIQTYETIKDRLK